jgi:cytochrome c peroxidase
MKTLLFTIALTSTLVASSLQQEARNFGLTSIPESKTELYKLIDNSKNPITDAKVSLGKMLFFDPRLSRSGFISCNSCHNLAMGGGDNLPAAVGHKWTVNPHHLSSPTVYNAVFSSSQFWDGRDPDLEKQAQGPIQAGPEMAATKSHVEAVVNSMPGYKKAFKHAYGQDVKIDFEKVTDTIATFERTLVTPSRYDKFLRGCDKALSSDEKEGLKTFIKVGCVSCHNGIALGGEMQGFALTAKYKYENIGDFRGNKNGLVKVPTLRNIAQTAPYFHNGAVKTLQEAIVEMGRIQLGVAVSSDEAESIEIFLKSLTGKKPYLGKVILPDASDTTPKPNLN